MWVSVVAPMFVAAFLLPASAHAAFTVNYSWSNAPAEVFIGVVDTKYDTDGYLLGWVAMKQGKTGSGVWDGKTVVNTDGSALPNINPALGPYRLIAITLGEDGNCCAVSLTSSFNITADGGTTLSFPAFSPLVSITPKTQTVVNNSVVNLIFTFPPGTIDTRLSMSCPAGVSISHAQAGEICGSDKRIDPGYGLTQTIPFTVKSTGTTPLTINSKIIAYYSDVDGDNVKATASIIVNPTSVPTIKVTTPNGGDRYTVKVGDKILVKWDTMNAPATSFVYPKLLFKMKGSPSEIDGNVHTVGLVPSGTMIIPNTGSYEWTVPDYIFNYVDPNGFKIQVDLMNSGYQKITTDDSDTFFTIINSVQPPVTSVTVVNPNRGETWLKDVSKEISWTVVGTNFRPLINLYTYSESCTTSAIRPCSTLPYIIVKEDGAITAARSSVMWTVGKTFDGKDIPNGTYILQICDYVAKTVCDISDKPFKIASQTTGSAVQVISPNGGETVALGESLGVIWNSASPLQSVDIKILNSAGQVLSRPSHYGLTPLTADGQSIGFATAATGELALPLGDYKARVCRAGTTECDDSNGTFKIIPAITGVSPRISGVVPQPVYVGSALTVNVTGAGRGGNIVLQTADGSKTWSNGYSIDISTLPGFLKYDGTKLTFTIPSTIGRGVHPDGWWNEPVVAVTPGLYNLYVSASDSTNNFIKSNVYSVQIGDTTNTTTTITESQLTALCYQTPSNPTVGQNINWQVAQSGGSAPYSYRWTGTDDLFSESYLATKTYTTSGVKSATVTIKTPQQTKVVTCSATIAAAPVTATYPTPRVVWPNGGESIMAGNGGLLKYYGGGTGKIKIDLVNTTNGTTAWIVNDVPLQTDPRFYDGIVTWSTRSDTVPGSAYKVRISRQSDGVVLDESDGTFTITPPPPGISVLTPYNLNEVYTPGKSVPIRYQALNFPAGTTYDIKLAKYSTGSIDVLTTIKAAHQNTGEATYTWYVPEVEPRSNYMYVICPTGSKENCGYSIGFTIAPAPSPTAEPVASPVSQLQSNKTLIGTAFYAAGDLVNQIFGW